MKTQISDPTPKTADLVGLGCGPGKRGDREWGGKGPRESRRQRTASYKGSGGGAASRRGRTRPATATTTARSPGSRRGGASTPGGEVGATRARFVGQRVSRAAPESEPHSPGRTEAWRRLGSSYQVDSVRRPGGFWVGVVARLRGSKAMPLCVGLAASPWYAMLNAPRTPPRAVRVASASGWATPPHLAGAKLERGLLSWMQTSG